MQGLYDTRKGLILSLAIIAFLMAFIAPAAIFYPIKAGFITLRNEGIGSSAWALLTGGIGLLLLSILFIVLGYVQRPLLKIGLAIILLIGSITGVLLSIRDYYYITKDEIVINGPFTLAESKYGWSDIAEYEEQVLKINGTLTVDKVIFTTKTGEIYEFTGGRMLGTMKEIAKSRVQSAGGTIVRTEMD